MSSSLKTPLSERQQLLLMKFVDDEASSWEGFFARGLIRRSQAAREFVQSLKLLSGELQRDSVGTHTRQSAWSRANRGTQGVGDAAFADALWEKVNRRIDDETRAALFLGKRRRTDSSASSMNWFQGAAWGLSGAAVTAALGFFVIAQPGGGPGAQQSMPRGHVATVSLRSGGSLGTGGNFDQGRSAAGQDVSFSQVRSLDESQSGDPRGVGGRAPRIIEDPLDDGRIPNAVEVDWMRGGGRVKLIPDASQRSAVIWVKRKRNAPIDVASLEPFSPREVQLVDPRAFGSEIDH